MADILKTLTSNLIQFADGERPSAAKFNALTKYFNRRVSDISRSIGDIYDDNTIDTLNRSIRWNHTDGKRRPIDILNLARIIGPTSNLNTRMFSERKTIQEEIPQGSTSYKLSYEVSSFDKLLTTGASFPVETLNKLSIFRETNSFTNENQYYYDSATNSLIFAKPTEFIYAAVYETDPNTYFGGANYIDSQFNVIPDPNATNDSLTITKMFGENNTYLIVLPSLTEQQSGLKDLSAYNDKDLDSDEFNKDSQIKLPDWMWNNQDPSFNLEENELIPSNTIYLKDRNLNESYLTASYYYVNNHTIRIKGVSLCIDENHDFALVTVGTDITTSIDDLRLKWFRHTHDGTFGEERIDIKNLAGIFVKEHVRLFVPNVVFSKSSIKDNHLPMYLHRIGYSIDTSTNNGNNSMLGTLLMGRLEFDYEDVSNQPVQSKDGVSNSISFGGIGDAGPSIYRDLNSDLVIKGQVDFKEGASISPNINIQSSTNINSNAIDTISNSATTIKENAQTIENNYKTKKQIRFDKEDGNFVNNKTYSKISKNDYTLNFQSHSIDNLEIIGTNINLWSPTDLIQTTVQHEENINIYNDYEHKYYFKPTIDNDLNNKDHFNMIPQLNMVGKVFNSSTEMKWLSTKGVISYNNGNENECPVAKYKDLNIQEFILPIKIDSFEFFYQKECEVDLSNFNYPWVNKDNTSTDFINASEDEKNIVSFGVLHENITSDENDVTYSVTGPEGFEPNVYSDDDFGDLTTGNDSMSGLPNSIRVLTLNNGSKRRSFNVININKLFTNNTFSLNETAIQSNSNRIKLSKLDNSIPDRRIYYEAVFINVKTALSNGVFASDSNHSPREGMDVTKYVKRKHGLNALSNYSYHFRGIQEGNSNAAQKVDFDTKGIINESFGIKVINKSNNKVYWLPGKFLNYTDFENAEIQDILEHQIYQDTTGNYSYYVLGNTLRFEINPVHIGLDNIDNFNINNFDFYIQYGFDSNYNQHEKLDNYTISFSHMINNNNTPDLKSHFYLKQTNNNCFYSNAVNNDNFNLQNIVKYSDYRGKPGTSSLTDSDSWDVNESKSYFPVPEEIKLTSFGHEYVHTDSNNSQIHSTKPVVERYSQIGENSQYLRFIRKVNNVNVSNQYYERKFKINCNKNNDLNKGVIRLGYVLSNLDFQFGLDPSDTNQFIAQHYNYEKPKKQIIDKLKILSMPNFILEYQSTNNVYLKNKDDFFFNSMNLLNQSTDSKYLKKNSNESFNKDIILKINGKEYCLIKGKNAINISLNLIKYFNDIFSNSFINYIDGANIKLSNEQRKLSCTSYHNEFNSIYDIFQKKNNNYRYTINTINTINNIGDFVSKYNQEHLSNIILDLNFELEIKEKIYSDKIVIDIDCNITNIEVISDDVY